MRILPRFNMPKRKAARRLWRKSKARLNLRRVYYSVELLLFLTIYFLVFSGSRLRTLDTFGRRTDAIVSLLLVATFILIHVIARRRLLPKIERYYAPAPYDERKIFFDLGQGSQNVTSIDQLYQRVAERVRNALDASNEQGGAHVVVEEVAALAHADASVEIHVVAHSAGSIFHAPLLQLLCTEGPIAAGPMQGSEGFGIPVKTCTMWALSTAETARTSRWNRPSADGSSRLPTTTNLSATRLPMATFCAS